MLYSIESVLGICWIGKTIEEIAEPKGRAASRTGRRTPQRGNALASPPQSENARSTNFAIPRKLASLAKAPYEAFRQPFFTQKLLVVDRKARFARMGARRFDRARGATKRDLGFCRLRRPKPILQHSRASHFVPFCPRKSFLSTVRPRMQDIVDINLLMQYISCIMHDIAFTAPTARIH